MATIVTTLVPRAVLQCLFFTLLGGLVAGADGRRYALIGGAAAVAALSGAVAVADVPATDKWAGTFHRLRTGVLSPFVVFALRSIPYWVLGLGYVVAALAVVAPLTGLTDTAIGLLRWLPVYALMAASTTAAGLAVATLAAGRRADVLLGNLMSYLILLTGGVFMPPGQVPWIDWLGQVLPVYHGVQAIHRGEAGRPWLAGCAREVLVGACWLLVAWLLVTVQVRRAQRDGIDDYA